MIPPHVPLLPAVVAVAVAVTAAAVVRAVADTRSTAMLYRLSPAEPETGPPDWFLAALEASGLAIRPHRAWTAATGAVALGAMASALRWPQLVAAGSILSLSAVKASRRVARGRELRSYDSDLAAVIDGLASRLATGTSLAVAFAEAAHHPSAVGRDIELVVLRHRHGQALQGAIDGWAGWRPTPGVRLLADALAIAGASGGSQRAALVGVQATLRDRESLAREVRALASQARTSGVVLALTPAAFAGVVALVDADVAAFFSSPAGWACLLGGALLNAGGALWMNRLTEAHR